MKLKKFKESNKKVIGVLIFTILCVMLVCGVILYRTFAIFEVRTNQNVINGAVQDPGNLYFAFYVDNQIQKNLPSKDEDYVFNSQKSYCGVLGEKDDSIKLWFDRDSWSVIAEGITSSRTKCNLYFDKGESLIDKIKSLNTVDEGDGLYKVSHNDATISYTDEEEKQNMLKQEERRYAGDNPNNYVWFNNELWRMIGLVNTPDGQRVKLIRKDSIGSYSWDSSDRNVNSGAGVNEWSQADLMILLNMYYYNSFDNQFCITGEANAKITCGFLKNGLKYVHSFIDYIEWNLGSNGQDITWGNNTTIQMYNVERSNATGDWCKSANVSYPLCTDKVLRNIIWIGNVAVMYPSDYGYATSGGIQCLSSNLFAWDNSCYEHNWLNKKVDFWTLTPSGGGAMAELAYRVNNVGIFDTAQSNTAKNYEIFPTLYLKSDILVSINSSGTIDSPYIIG